MTDETRIALAGELSLGGTRRQHVELLTTPDGPVVVAGDGSDGPPVHVALLGGGNVRYRPGSLQDGIQVGGETLWLPRGSGNLARQAIVECRLRTERPAVTLAPGYLVEALDDVESRFLAGHLEVSDDGDDEVVLVWLTAATTTLVEDPLLPGARARWRLLITDRRAQLVALSILGASHVRTVGGPIIHVGREFRSAGYRSDGERWTGTRGNQGAHEAAVTLLDHPTHHGAGERLLGAAAAEWVQRHGRRGAPDRAIMLVQTAMARGAPEAVVAHQLLFANGAAVAPPDDLAGALGRLDEDRPDAVAVVWERFGGVLDAGEALLGALRRHGAVAEPWGMELHRRIHRARAERRGGRAVAGSIEGTEQDLDLAEHLIAVGAPTEAAILLEERLQHLPSEAMEDLLPDQDADLTRGGGGQALRRRTHELLAEARRGEPGELEARIELARLQPLVIDRLQPLSRLAGADLSVRANDALEALAPGALGPDLDRPPGPRLRVVPPSLVDNELRHPLGRRGSPMLERLQTLIAEFPVPDHSALVDFCEQLNPDRFGDAARILEDAARVLGVEAVNGYVSRGKKSIGVRAYEAAIPFVVVGGRHMDPGDRLEMGPRSLAFSVSAEVAHLRFGHSRVTQSDVWAGALSKGKAGLEVMMSLLPAFHGFRLADRLRRGLSRVPLRALERALGLAAAQSKQRQARKVSAADDDPGLSAPGEQLILAHRLMQLTADRAGLLLSGDLRSALRAILLMRREYHDALDVIEEQGLADYLGRREDDGQMEHQDLAVRTAALIAFYLSDEYAKLEQAVRPRLAR